MHELKTILDRRYYSQDVICRHLCLKGNGVSNKFFREISTPKDFPIENLCAKTWKMILNP